MPTPFAIDHGHRVQHPCTAERKQLDSFPPWDRLAGSQCHDKAARHGGSGLHPVARLRLAPAKAITSRALAAVPSRHRYLIGNAAHMSNAGGLAIDLNQGRPDYYFIPYRNCFCDLDPNAVILLPRLSGTVKQSGTNIITVCFASYAFGPELRRVARLTRVLARVVV
jgi:hypothetical protein